MERPLTDCLRFTACGLQGFVASFDGTNERLQQSFSVRAAPGQRCDGRSDAFIALYPPSDSKLLTFLQGQGIPVAHTMSGSFLYSILSLYGKTPDEAAAIRAKWEPLLKTALGMAAAPAES